MRPFAAVFYMGIFATLFGCSKANGDLPNHYVTEAAFQKNLINQTTMAPETVAQLRKHGVAEDANLKLEFFFYTDKDAKVQELASALRSLDYEVESRPSANDSRLLVVKGWTVPVKMTDAAVVAWTDQMCRLGFEHDCEFDGWGTNPTQ